jgi:hypothetical protein
MMKWGIVAWVLLSEACRLAGPEGNPTDLSEVDADLPEDEPGPEGGSAAPLDAGGGVGGAGGGVGGAVDAGATVDSDADTMGPASTDSSVARCTAPAGLECDPVSGEGCLPLMQCVVDTESKVPAAYCVFSGIQLDVTCTQDGLSTDCPPQHTCVMGECRKYCYCDSDCENGAACADPSGEGGSTAFKLCARTSP